MYWVVMPVRLDGEAFGLPHGGWDFVQRLVGQLLTVNSLPGLWCPAWRTDLVRRRLVVRGERSATPGGRDGWLGVNVRGARQARVALKAAGVISSSERPKRSRWVPSRSKGHAR